MALYLTVAEGTTPRETRTILAVSDQRLIAEMLRSIGRLGSRHAIEPEAEPAHEPVLSIAARPPRKPAEAR